MYGEFVYAITALTGFFAIMNPIGNTPIFLGLTNGMDLGAKRAVARRAVTIAFLIVVLFTVFGSIIFKLFGITLPAFQVAGGILVFLVGYQLLHGRESAIHHPAADERGPEEIDEVAISPLAIPILAGPGTISTALNFAGNGNPLHISVVLGSFAVICIATYVAFLSGERLVQYVRPSIIKVVTRLMGVIITVIAAQMIMTGISHGIHIH